jgi:site-specific recombinase XerD
MEYLRHLQNKGVRMSTIHRDFSAISGLYEYLIFCDAVTVNPVKQIKSRYLNQPEEPERRYQKG